MSPSAKVRRLAELAVFTAIVAALQSVGAMIRFGTATVSLVLIPIVIGAALLGPLAGAWLGLVFSLIVLFTDTAAFMVISIPGTILTVLLKGTLAGYASGLVYRCLEKKNEIYAAAAAALVCPIVNTGIFLIGCRLFFFDMIRQLAQAAGFQNAYVYLLIGLAGLNFLFEIIVNMLLSPAIIRIIQYRSKMYR